MKKVLDVPYDVTSLDEVLEKTKKNTLSREEFFHIVSVNPENVLLARQDEKFKRVIETAQIRIADGTGIVMAARILGRPTPSRLTGVDLMTHLLELADEYSLTVLLIGGRPKIAKKVIECQSHAYPNVQFLAERGIDDIRSPRKEEEEKILSIVSHERPHMIFASFGSPAQELWLHSHRASLKGAVCMGVGGAFDFLSGAVPRAPLLVRRLGLEWLYRLMRQPWRLSRQIKLAHYIALIVREKIKHHG